MKLNEPLGQPQGTVRAIIALVVILGAVASHLFGQDDNFLDVLAGTAFGFYFASRQQETAVLPRTETEVLAPTTIKGNQVEEHDDAPVFIAGE